MKKTMRAMTFIELVVCMALISICLVMVVLCFHDMGKLKAQVERQASLEQEVASLVLSLEATSPKEEEGALSQGWHYKTVIQDENYYVEIQEEDGKTRYRLLLRRGPL